MGRADAQRVQLTACRAGVVSGRLCGLIRPALRRPQVNRSHARIVVSTIAQTPGLLDRHHFLLRRLHSLTGIIPVGAFLFNHMLTNATAWLDAEHFNHHVGLIHSLPFLLAIEIVFIFIPIAFHAAYGVVIALQGRSNATRYPYMDNWRYTIQRFTAWITVVFIVVHLLHFRFAHWFGVLEYKDANPYFFNLTQHVFGMPLPMGVWMAIYLIGVVAAVFHFCNGIVTFCITWGITVGVEARKRVSVAAAGLGALLILWAVLSLYALATYEPERLPADHQLARYLHSEAAAD